MTLRLWRLVAHIVFSVLLLPACADDAVCAGQQPSSESSLLQVQTNKQERSLLAHPEAAVTRGSRIAVVLVLGTLDKCRAARARTLATSLDSSKFDTWLLHGSETQNPKLMSMLGQVNFHFEAQSDQDEHGGWREFGSKLSGYAKASFLRFVIRHPEYEYVWHLEDDVSFIGDWGQLFNQLQYDFPTQSLVGKIVDQSYNTSKWFLHGCRLQGNASCGTMDAGEGAALTGQDAMDPELEGQGEGAALTGGGPMHMHVEWMLARVSHDYAVKLGAQLDATAGARGHHEAIAGPFCFNQRQRKNGGWCTMGRLSDRVLGIFETGHWGNWIHHIITKSRADGLDPNKLYHPVKCESYQTIAELVQKGI